MILRYFSQEEIDLLARKAQALDWLEQEMLKRTASFYYDELINVWVVVCRPDRKLPARLWKGLTFLAAIEAAMKGE